MLLFLLYKLAIYLLLILYLDSLEVRVFYSELISALDTLSILSNIEVIEKLLVLGVVTK